MEKPVTTSSTLPAAGRLMALDLGEKRIGLALSDPQQRLARPLSVLRRRSRREDRERIARLVAEHEVAGVLLGLPITLDGGDSRMTEWVRHYGSELAASLAVPLAFWDESFSTQQATDLLKARGVSAWRRRKEQVDAIAAAFILQSYLDARLPVEPNRERT